MDFSILFFDGLSEKELSHFIIAGVFRFRSFPKLISDWVSLDIQPGAAYRSLCESGQLGLPGSDESGCPPLHSVCRLTKLSYIEY